MILLFILNICVLIVCHCVVYGSGKQPNIVFILADDLGWNDVGFHGSEIKTPVIDKLAYDGVRLENYYVQPICSPTRTQLLSGRYQIHTGLQHSIIWGPQPNGLPLEDPTIADKLREQGYSTHVVGKWHVGFYKKEYTPMYRGFDSFYGYLTGGEDYFTHRRCYSLDDEGNPAGSHGNSGGSYDYQPSNQSNDADFQACGMDLRENETVVWNETGVYSTNLFASKAQDIIGNHAKNTPTKPLFMYLPFQAVHAPMQVPQKYIDMYSFIKDKKRRIYAGMTTCLDDAVHNITETLKEHGLWDNTVLIFSADNGGIPVGGGNNWPLRGYKTTLWEGGMRAAGFVHSPLLKDTPRSNYGLVHVSDWFPTLLKLAGGTTTGLKLDGYDVWDTISQGSSSPRKELLHNIDPLYKPKGARLYNDTFDTRIRAAIRVDNWKLITGDPGPGIWVPPPQMNGNITDYRLPEKDTQNVWLFDILGDPFERVDLSTKYPSIVKTLLDRLDYYNSTAVPCRYPPYDKNSDPAKHGGAWGPWE